MKATKDHLHNHLKELDRRTKAKSHALEFETNFVRFKGSFVIIHNFARLKPSANNHCESPEMYIEKVADQQRHPRCQ